MDSSGSSTISFSVTGTDENTFDINEIDIHEILRRKFDTDETDSDGERGAFRDHDSGVELSFNQPINSDLLAQLAANTHCHNTGRFPSHDSYDSDDSNDEYEIPLRAIHNDEDAGGKNWHKVPSSVLRRQYESIRSSSPSGHFSTSRFPQNQSRNRYSDVPCYDHTRVKLRDTRLSDRNDYFNANYCDGFNSKRKYICTQGPLDSTAGHFWQMVWENNSRVIVMTTRLVERGKVKCAEYWPQDGETRQYGYFTVRDTEEELVEEHYKVQKLELEFDGITREIFHYLFTQWPDFGIPKSPEMLLDFQDQVRARHQEVKSTMISPYDPPTPKDEDPFEITPIVVHCSAGIGRTGTYLAIDICREWLAECNEISLRDCLTRIRSQRAFSVQTADQFKFCHQALLHDTL